MGAPADEPCHSSAEIPLHEVTLTRGLLVAIYEVTQDQWSLVTGLDNPSYFGSKGEQPLCTSGICPVERVNWFEALRYCNLLSQQAGITACYELTGCSGLPGSGCPPGMLWCDGDFTCTDVVFQGLDCPGYRLPTEAEWEYVARAGATQAFAWPLPDGGAKNDSCECGIEANLMPLGWFCHNAGTRTHEVGLKEPNGWGLFDVSGNVWEWCWDGLHYYGEEAVVDPLTNEGNLRAVRGGSFFDFSHHCRLAARDFDEKESRYPDIGFRVVRSLPPALTLEPPDGSE